MHFLEKVGGALAFFSLYLPSLICFPIIILCEACLTSPPNNVLQAIPNFVVAVSMVWLAIKLIILIYLVRQGRYSYYQSKRIMLGVFLVTLVFIAGTAFGFVVVSHSWMIAIIIISYFVYGICLVGSLYRYHLIPEGFIKKSKG